MEDTIAAISTSLGVGAISIIRVSGNESIDIVNKIFKGKNLKEVESHTINYGHIIDNDLMIDEVLVSVMRSPKTFTKEDILLLPGGKTIYHTLCKLKLMEEIP